MRAVFFVIAAGLIGIAAPALEVTAEPEGRAATKVSVTISGPPSAISLATGIRFSTIGLPSAAGTAPAPAVPTGEAVGIGSLSLSTDGLASDGGNTPGAFVVSGGPLQTFSIWLPQAVVLDVNGALLELRDFRHSGGVTPTTGPDGTTRIAFTADVNRDQLELFQKVALASADAGTIFLEVPADAIAAQGIAVAGEDDGAAAVRIPARRPKPFGTPDSAEKQVFVLISYN